jgi:hypothetical protein
VIALLLLPAALQAVAMAFDELWFHRRRGLPRWERLGHPVDTLSVAAAYGWLIATRPSMPHALAVYVALAAFSSLLVTKDEPVHARRCRPGEQWLHAVLFVLHPVVFLGFGVIWWRDEHRWLLVGQLGLTLGLMFYQLIYWSIWWPSRRSMHTP